MVPKGRAQDADEAMPGDNQGKMEPDYIFDHEKKAERANWSGSRLQTLKACSLRCISISKAVPPKISITSPNRIINQKSSAQIHEPMGTFLTQTTIVCNLPLQPCTGAASSTCQPSNARDGSLP